MVHLYFTHSNKRRRPPKGHVGKKKTKKTERHDPSRVDVYRFVFRQTVVCPASSGPRRRGVKRTRARRIIYSVTCSGSCPSSASRINRNSGSGPRRENRLRGRRRASFHDVRDLKRVVKSPRETSAAAVAGPSHRPWTRARGRPKHAWTAL